jgi:hypothetical protein
MSLLNQIENNEIVNLHISAQPKEALEGKNQEEALIKALGKNNSITSVHLEQEFLACLRADNRSIIVNAIGKLPSLRQVYLSDTLLLGNDVKDLLVNAKAVTTLHLANVCFQGAPEYFDALATVLKHHASLKDFELIDCMASNQSVELEKLTEAAAASHRNSCSGGGVVPGVAMANTATAKSA